MALERQTGENVKDLVIEVCRCGNGIGFAKAGAVAEDFEGNLQAFLEADASRFKKIKTSKGSSILSDSQIKQIIDEKSNIPQHVTTAEAWVYFLGRSFLRNQVNGLLEIELDDLDINPFLVKVLDLRTPEQIIEFNLFQSVTRSIVTSWGTLVEEIIIRCGTERFSGKSMSGRAGRRPDIKLKRGNHEYYFQIKSGPNTMNVDMVNSLNEVIDEYRRRLPNARFILGMTYGKRRMISPQIRNNLSNFDHTTMIGRELWDFISAERDYHTKIFSMLDAASEGVLRKPFSSLMGEKTQSLANEWRNKYKGQTIDQVLEYYV